MTRFKTVDSTYSDLWSPAVHPEHRQVAQVAVREMIRASADRQHRFLQASNGEYDMLGQMDWQSLGVVSSLLDSLADQLQITEKHMSKQTSCYLRLGRSRQCFQVIERLLGSLQSMVSSNVQYLLSDWAT